MKEREKIVSLNAKSLLMCLSQIRKRIVTHILKAVLSCCTLTWKSLITLLWGEWDSESSCLNFECKRRTKKAFKVKSW